jgi:protoheme IX farnesyltransferase
LKSAVLTAPDQAIPLTRPRLADYLQLTRPRIGVMVLFTVAVGFLLASGPEVRVALLLHTLVGTGLVASGASTLNQWLERKTDARMKRTANRPLPAGRIYPIEALLFGSLLGIVGIGYLALMLPSPAAAIVAAVTFVSYVGIYTPMKPYSIWNTVVGAVPGALPPVIGWCAVQETIGIEAVALFLIMFVWQLPHFFAIAWLYRDDYAAGGLRMLPAIDPTGRLTAKAMVAGSVLLLPVTMVPSIVGLTGPFYLAGAIFLSVCFLNCAIHFRKSTTRTNARHVLRSSLFYLTGIMLLLVYDGFLPRLFAK